MTDLQNKTPEELQVIIAEAQTQLEALHHSKHKGLFPISWGDHYI